MELFCNVVGFDDVDIECFCILSELKWVVFGFELFDVIVIGGMGIVYFVC